MNDLTNLLSQSFDESFSILGYVTNIIICAILLYLLSVVYVKYGKSISNRFQLSRVLILVGITTFIIISIVKSSLALSLGLVGALSIIRFRTAIKEPEELGYFFMAISIGLGLGANQLYPTIIGFVVLVMVIILLNLKKSNNLSQNLLISLRVAEGDKSKIGDEISEIVTTHCNQVNLKRLKYSEGLINFNFLVNVDSFDEIKKINDQLISFDNSIDITFIDSEI
ncbi:DUF4956 domain-containing protein [uncultured Maribacter sp.]|uniref:DUF4956 domain-containing protein n=1 Tax=uncultured Maribacter sp. TaxID=431308 RepID=UPI0030D8A522|tara:strand:- start:6267 stop:6941 length:675 start_codon:yes stop_codon:yes gene_type:complete